MDIGSRAGNRRIRLMIVVAVVVVLPLATACGSDETAGPERGITVGDIQQEQYFYEGEYVGQTVTVSARVNTVLGPSAFELSGGDYGDDTLLVLTRQPTRVTPGQVLRVTGTVGQFHRGSIYDPDLYATYEAEAYLADATVEPLPTPRSTS